MKVNDFLPNNSLQLFDYTKHKFIKSHVVSSAEIGTRVDRSVMVTIYRAAKRFPVQNSLTDHRDTGPLFKYRTRYCIFAWRFINDRVPPFSTHTNLSRETVYHHRQHNSNGLSF